jgi:hypothetical protein
MVLSIRRTMRIDGHAGGLGRVHHRPFPMASGEMDCAEFIAFPLVSKCMPP